MKIRKSHETLILTQSEKAILSKAISILEDIYQESEHDGDMERDSDVARDCLNILVDNAEIEGGEPTGTINITITM